MPTPAMADALALSTGKEGLESTELQRTARRKRISNLWSWTLQRRLAELSAQVEAAVIEVGYILVCHKQTFQKWTVLWYCVALIRQDCTCNTQCRARQTVTFAWCKSFQHP